MAVLICICDVVFNYLFIYVMKMGVVGAACGTALAYICISLPNLYLTACRNRILNLRQDKESFRWVKEYLHHACKISIPIAIQNVLMSGAQIVSTMIVAPLAISPLLPTRLPSPPRASAICRVMVSVMPPPPWWVRRMVPGVPISAAILPI